jgi:hypothetical protein
MELSEYPRSDGPAQAHGRRTQSSARSGRAAALSRRPLAALVFLGKTDRSDIARKAVTETVLFERCNSADLLQRAPAEARSGLSARSQADCGLVGKQDA